MFVVLGTVVVVLSPTRELSMQTYAVLQQLTGRQQLLTHALLTGGTGKEKEVASLSAGTFQLRKIM